MIENIINFISMGGYGFYVWMAYGIVLTFLTIQWFIPLRRWRKFLSNQKLHNE